MLEINRRTLLQAVPWFGFGCVLGRVGQAQDQVVATFAPQKRQSVKVDVLLEVGGELKLNEQSKPRALKMSVVGRMAYVERLLEIDSQQTTMFAARRYEQADAVIKIGQGGTRPTLREARRLVGVSVTPEQPLLFSLEGAMTRDELDLIDVPMCSVMVDRLLPGRQVTMGDRWQHANELLAQLLGLDAVSKSDVYSELKEITGTQARFELAGSVNGAIHGVASDMQLKGRYKFDTTLGRITWLAILIDEQRSIGHVGPGADVTSRLQMTIAPTETPTELADESVKTGVWDQSQAVTNLEYRSPKGGFVCLHDRRWHAMNESTETVALRLVERGELVAQCNISAIPKVEAGKHATLEKFQQDIQQTLGKSFGQFTQASESSNQRGFTMYRVLVAGSVSELPIQWNYYLIADRDGHQVVLAFTVEDEQIPRMADSDLMIAESVEFIEPTATASKPLLSR